MILFNQAPVTELSKKYVIESMDSKKTCGDGSFTHRCGDMLKPMIGTKGLLLTTSCTHALEMAAILCDIKPGDEVIMPSYTFVSTADAFVMRGAKIVFVDIREDTMNIDEELIEDAITPRTKAIVPVHYAGVGCEMDEIMDIATRHNLKVVEDAAQGIAASYKGDPLGSIGDFGCFSFHETKNISMGEGGALTIRDESLIELAEIIREKGTNRSKFFRGQIDKYTWVEAGSSYLPSDINAAYLLGQLEMIDEIQRARIDVWNAYDDLFRELDEKEIFERPFIPDYCEHNAHMYYVKLKDLDTRTRFIDFMKKKEILCVFHYIPLHTAPAGQKYGTFYGEDKFTTRESERLVRLPLYYGMSENDRTYILDSIREFAKS